MISPTEKLEWLQAATQTLSMLLDKGLLPVLLISIEMVEDESQVKRVMSFANFPGVTEEDIDMFFQDAMKAYVVGKIKGDIPVNDMGVVDTTKQNQN